MEKIGFIGLGIMGKPMAINLLNAGYSVKILQSSAAADEVTSHGAATAVIKKEIAQSCDVIITMLPDSPEVQEALLGAEGILEGLKPGSLFVDMSTISPAVSIEIAGLVKGKGSQSLDAPVSGGQVGAEAATLSIMVGGDTEAFSRALPIFRVLGKNIVHIGGDGAGQTTKACNQLIVGVTIQGVAEAFALAEKSGVDLVKMREVLLGGFAQSRILDLHGQRIIDKNFKPGFRIRLHKKDMSIVLDTAALRQTQLPAARLVFTQMEKMVANGDGELDHSALYLYI